MRKFEYLPYEEVNLLCNALTFSYIFATEHRDELSKLIDEFKDELEIRG